MPVLTIGADSVYGEAVEQSMKQGVVKVRGVVIAKTVDILCQKNSQKL